MNLVPTLLRGNAVRDALRPRSSDGGDAERRRRHSHAERGNEGLGVGAREEVLMNEHDPSLVRDPYPHAGIRTVWPSFSVGSLMVMVALIAVGMGVARVSLELGL